MKQLGDTVSTYNFTLNYVDQHTYIIFICIQINKMRLSKWLTPQIIFLTVFFILILVIIFIHPQLDKEYVAKIFPNVSDDYAIERKKKRTNKCEEKCRKIFEEIFDAPFESVRPDWLKNPVTGKNLELDGFNASIETPLGKGLAFEYDGQQHARYVPHFHSSNEEFEYQQTKDNWKNLQCLNKGIVLIRIPHDISSKIFRTYIMMELQRHKIEF